MAAAILCLLAALHIPGALPTQDDVIEAAVLKVLDLKHTPLALREFIAARTPVAITGERFALLVRDLGVEDFKTREAAQAELVRGGPTVVDRLRAAAEATKNSRQGDLIKGSIIRITKMEWSLKGVAAYRAAVRAVARRPDAAAVPCLLGSLPSLAEDDEVQAAVWRALDVLTVRAGAVPRACADARKDSRPELRALAAFLLGRRGTEEQRRQAVEMLTDPEPTVRLRAAQGLLGAGDLSGIQALVALLEAKPVTLAWEAEELLVWLAGESAPAERIGDGRDAAKVRATWARWRERTKPDWKAAAAAPSRPLLLLVRDDESQVLRPSMKFCPTVLLGCDGKVRWKASPPDDQSLLIDRVTNKGQALGFSWTNPDPRQPASEHFPTFCEFPIGGKFRPGPDLKFAPGYSGETAARRWAFGWTLIAGPERYGFIPPGQNTVSHWGELPLYKDNPSDPGQEIMGRLLGERDGLLCYLCNIPPSRMLGSTILIEPGSGQCPAIPQATFSRMKTVRWNEVQIGSGLGTVTAAEGRVWETIGGQRVWETQLERWSMRVVSLTLPLVSFGFDDLTVPRKTLEPLPTR